jgi:anti-anti-sigma factor
MRMNISKAGGKVRAHLGEALDISSVLEAKEQLSKALRKGSQIDFDLSGLAEIDTAGVQLLLSTRRQARADKVDCRFLRPSPEVLRAFTLLGRADFLDESVHAN